MAEDSSSGRTASVFEALVPPAKQEDQRASAAGFIPQMTIRTGSMEIGVDENTSVQLICSVLEVIRNA